MKIYEVRGLFNSLKGRWTDRQSAENHILHLEDMYGMENLKIVEVEDAK